MPKLLLQSELSFCTYLIFRSIPVVDYARRDEKTVIHMAAAAVIPPTVIAHLGFPIGKAYGSLTSCSKRKKKSIIIILSKAKNKDIQPSS